jgi:hypothetical protein
MARACLAAVVACRLGSYRSTSPVRDSDKEKDLRGNK